MIRRRDKSSDTFRLAEKKQAITQPFPLWFELDNVSSQRLWLPRSSDWRDKFKKLPLIRSSSSKREKKANEAVDLLNVAKKEKDRRRKIEEETVTRTHLRHRREQLPSNNEEVSNRRLERLRPYQGNFA